MAAVRGHRHGAVRRARRCAGEKRPWWLARPLFIIRFPPLFEQTQGLNAGICQRSTTCRVRGIMLLQDYWNPIFITTLAGGARSTKGCISCFVLNQLHSTDRGGLLTNSDMGKVVRINRECWKWDKSECVPFITGLFILVNIKQKQQQNQELTSSRSCNYRFSYIDKLIYNGCHRRDMITSVSKKYGNEPFLWISSTRNIRLLPAPVMLWVLVQLSLKSVMTGILSELSLYVIMW